MAQFNWLNQWRDVGRKNGHSPFDLSQRICFTTPNGLIQPIHFLETVPDDHIQIDLSGLLRTETMNTAAFFSGKMFVDSFFVPYSQIWHNFNQFVSQKEDFHSSSLRSSAYMPYVQLIDIVTFVCNLMTASYKFFGMFGSSEPDLAYDAIRFLQMAGIVDMSWLIKFRTQYPDNADFKAAVENYLSGHEIVYNKSVNLFRLAAYHHIFYDIYRNKYYDETPHVYSYSLGDGIAREVSWIDTFNFDDIGAVRSSSPTIYDFDYFEQTTSHPVLWTNFNVNNQKEVFYFERFANLISLHYHQFRKDLFTSLMPSTQFGAVSSLSFSATGTITNGLEIVSGKTFYSSGAVTPGSENTVSFKPASDSAHYGLIGFDVDNDFSELSHFHSISGSLTPLLSSSFDVLQLRKAEVLQQWKQNALRAGNMVDDNFKSHYGVEPYYEADNNVKFLGSWEINLEINPVTATASTGASENGSVGDLAALGVGNVVGSPIDFQCKDFGVIVSCAYFLADSYYGSAGLDKANTLLEPFDFFSPEFENVGFEPVDLSLQNNNIELDNSIMGYTPPYTMYKTAFDKLYGSFQTLEFNDPVEDPEKIVVVRRGSLAPWVIQRSDISIESYSADQGAYEVPPTWNILHDTDRFYQSPFITNSVFGVNYDGTWETDPILCSFNFNIKAVRPMSVLGLPIFA